MERQGKGATAASERVIGTRAWRIILIRADFIKYTAMSGTCQDVFLIRACDVESGIEEKFFFFGVCFVNID